MIAPTRRGVLVLATSVPLALLPALLASRLWVAWAAASGATLAAWVIEWLLLPPPSRFALEARAPATLYVGERDALRVHVQCQWPWPIAVTLLCDFDDLLARQGPARVVAAREAVEAQIPLEALRRGTTEVAAAWLRWSGPLGLLRWTHRRPLDLSLAIVPNMRAVRAAALRYLSARQFLAGLKQQRHAGDGSEFDSLREHMTGFDSRAIDWKASAKHRKLLSREYRAERNHAVMLAIDTGRLMSEAMGGIPKLDHAINAALLLAYVALKTGDRVGLFAFDQTAHQYLPPRGGLRSFGHIQMQSAAIAYTHAETNFTSCLLDLGQRLSRRSLVVVLTDFVDTVTAELMIENLARLGRNNLVICVALRDAYLDRLAAAEPRSLADLNRAVSAHDLVREREVVLGRLRRLGVHCIDAVPAQVSSRLINSYLDAKRRELV